MASYFQASCLDSNMSWFIFLFLFLSSFCNFQVVATQSRCNHQAEISALLQFKDNFQIYCTAFNDGRNLGYPKTSSWNTTKSLVEWDGVVCDPISGHVISLDLSSSCLHGFNNSINNSIFSLLGHLEHLNLAFNDFQGSSIPSTLSNLSRLTYLNLSSSSFYGQVPLEISKLSMLTSLDLSNNLDLELNLNSLVENLTNLEELDLTLAATINPEVPKWLFKNMSSLRSLKLEMCHLYGKIPQDIFHLPNLQHLNIAYNEKLEGDLPTDFNSSNTPLLESLMLGETNFSGVIPDSIGNLVLLRILDLNHCKFSGSIPASLGKLINLRYLDISGVNLIGEIPPSLANLTNLSYLDLSKNRLTGQIPSLLCIQLSVLQLYDNQLTGEIPLGFGNFTKLTWLDLSNNKLNGPLPIRNLRNLEQLYVQNNMLSDKLELEMFLGFSNLTSLVLSSNNLTLLQQTNVSTTATLPKFEVLGLSFCRLSKFPDFLMHQQILRYLDLSSNNVEGPIPNWMGSSKTLYYMDLSHNFITTLNDPLLFLRWSTLAYLDISYNKLEGPVPIPSPFVGTYRASNNKLTGEIPHSMCNLSVLELLDFSSNRLTGEVDPHCFNKYYLTTLNLRNNSFSGKIPEFCKTGTNSILRMIDLNTNKFQGKIPRSLTNCVGLEFFDVGSNFINDNFPSWLGSLSQLKVFILKDNALHGSMEMMPNMSGYWFPELIIIDLSQNNLSGNLTSWRFEQWMAMKDTNLLRNASYMGQDIDGYSLEGTFYDYSLIMYNKGTEREYSKILNALITINLSNNRLEGEIPSTIADLRGLHLLNLSNNHLYGGIPSALGDLTELESLDLSSNELSGQIPQQLTELNFLSDFDVSNNNLTGLIPQGRQFDTFSNISYLGNLGLCGEPLSRKCEISRQEDAQPPDEMAESRDKFWEELKGEILWMVVAMGFGGGLVVGVTVENMVDGRMLIRSWRSKNRSSRRQVQKN